MPLDDDTAARSRMRLVRLAAWLGDPAEWAPDGGGDAGLDAGARQAMAQSAVLRPVLNRWLADGMNLAALPFEPGFPEVLAQDEDTALAALVVTAPAAQLDVILRLFGAAVWQDRLRLAVLRTEREQLAATLGDDAMAFGLRRAPVLARALADPALMPASGDAIAAGRALCAALVARAHPALLAALALRWPDMTPPVELSERQVQAARTILYLQGIAV